MSRTCHAHLALAPALHGQALAGEGEEVAAKTMGATTAGRTTALTLFDPDLSWARVNFTG